MPPTAAGRRGGAATRVTRSTVDVVAVAASRAVARGRLPGARRASPAPGAGARATESTAEAVAPGKTVRCDAAGLAAAAKPRCQVGHRAAAAAAGPGQPL